jgi:hypothetical protein
MIAEIRSKNPSSPNVPPANLKTTMSAYARACGGNPVPASELYRYEGRTFGDVALWELMSIDGSFEVQGQWFAAADYGLFQVIPETARSAIMEIPDAEQAPILALYNPSRDSPAKLFDPDIAARVGAMIDGRAEVTGEHATPLTEPEQEPACTPDKKDTKCSWERFWRRRFRLFNTGDEEGTPAKVLKKTYGCQTPGGNPIPYDACVITAAENKFLPKK